ncbi:hypothetical protein AAG906_035419 [Vitis piasezkii]
MEPAVLDDIIERLLAVKARPGKQVQLSEAEIRQLCVASKDIFLRQPNLLELQAPVKICGDIHGQYSDLLRLFDYGGLPPESNYLFLGDYVDRGKQSLETICLLLAYKIRYPENFFLLRGNHECASINRIYGFYDECKRRFNVRLWKVFTDCFNCLPVAALIDEKILCMHAPTDVPDAGLLCDLLWSDPSNDVRGWGMNDRGVSYVFGPDKVTELLQKHDLDLICRAHQVVEDGYEFFANRQLVTIFSAPNYCVWMTLSCVLSSIKTCRKEAKFSFGSTTTAKPGSSPARLKGILAASVFWCWILIPTLKDGCLILKSGYLFSGDVLVYLYSSYLSLVQKYERCGLFEGESCPGSEAKSADDFQPPCTEVWKAVIYLSHSSHV